MEIWNSYLKLNFKGILEVMKNPNYLEIKNTGVADTAKEIQSMFQEFLNHGKYENIFVNIYRPETVKITEIGLVFIKQDLKIEIEINDLENIINYIVTNNKKISLNKEQILRLIPILNVQLKNIL